MASQKLGFLKKIDPETVRAEVARSARRGGGAAAAARGAGGGAARRRPTSADVFAVIRDYIEQNPELAAKVGTTFLLQARRARQRLDARPQERQGRGRRGRGDTADCTLELVRRGLPAR